MNMLNQLFDKIYIITSYSTQNRIADLISFLNSQYITFELIVAPKKKYIIPDYNKTVSNEGNQSLTSANESIFLKEFYIKSESFLIFEDDVYFDADYIQKLNLFLTHIPKNWDILNLGYHEYTPINTKLLESNVFYKLEKEEEIVGTHVIAYKRNTIDYLIRSIDSSIYPMDWFLSRNVYSNFNVYVPTAKIFYASSYREYENKEFYYKKYKSEIHKEI